MTKADIIPREPQPATHDSAIVSVIERAALNPDVDIDKMERLLQMQERIMDREAQQAFNAAMAEAQAEMGPIVRNKYNDQTRSHYTDLAGLDAVIRPIYSRHGFAPSFGTGKSDLENHYKVTCRLMHSGGHSEPYEADVPADGVGIKGSANKTATHAFGSSLSYGQRYLLKLMFNLATADDDGNAAGAPPAGTVSAEQYITLRDLIEASGTDEAVVLKAFNAPSLELFPLAGFDAACKRLRLTIEKKAGA